MITSDADSSFVSTSGTVTIETVVFTGAAISSVTSVSMSSTLSGLTDQSMSGSITTSKAGDAILFSSGSDVNIDQSGGGHLNLKATGTNKYTFVEDVQFNGGAVSSVTTLGMN